MQIFCYFVTNFCIFVVIYIQLLPPKKYLIIGIVCILKKNIIIINFKICIYENV